MKELLMIALIPARFRLSSTKPIFASFVFLFCCNAIRADDPPKAASKATLTNDDVKRLLEIHISEDQILQAIQKNDGTFNISKDAITQLKTTGLTANIARAMEDANKRKLQQDQDAVLRSVFDAKDIPDVAPTATPDAFASSISLSTTSIDFGTQSLGTKSDPKEVTVTNTGKTDIPIFVPRFLPSPNQATPPFQILDTSTCGPKLAGGSTCKIQVVFSPFSFELSQDLKKPESVLPFNTELQVLTNADSDILAKQRDLDLAAASFAAKAKMVSEAEKKARRIKCGSTVSPGDAAADARDAATIAKQATANVDKDGCGQLRDQELLLEEARTKLISSNSALNTSVNSTAMRSPNTVSLAGTPKRWTFPFTSFVAGLAASAASSQDVQQIYFVQASLIAPFPRFILPSKEQDPLNRRLWVFLNPRITSLPFQDSNAAVSSLNTNADFLSGLLSGKISGITQGFDFNTGLEWACPVLCRKPREGAGWITDFQGATVRAVFSNSFVVGVGGSTPFSSQKTAPPAFAANDSVLQGFGCQPNLSFSVKREPFCSDLVSPVPGTPPLKSNVSFLFPDRSRFFYKYFVGMRFKTFFFNPDVHGRCSNSKETGSCEMPFNVFPGTVDLTAGKDAIVTGGRLSKWLFRIDVVHPLPFVPGLHIFGSTYMGLGKTRETPPITLVPVAASNATDANTERIILPRPDRDIYRIGIGIDLIQLLSKANGKPADTKAKPPADTATNDALAAAANPPAAAKQKATPNPKSPPPAQGGAANQDRPANKP